MVVANSYCIAVSLGLWDHANTQYQYVMTLLLAEVPAHQKPKPGSSHMVASHALGIQRRCAQCGILTAYVCTTCNLALHPAMCFAQYHAAQGDDRSEEEEEEEEEEDEEDEEVEETEDEEETDLSDEEIVDEDSEVDD
jgi:hypothetical protein